MNSSNHPIWFLLRIIVLLTTLLLILYSQANEFDDNEIEIIKWFLMAAVGWSGLEYVIIRVANGKKKK